MRSYLILSIALFVAALVQPALSVPHQTNRTEILERYIQKTRIKQQWQRANPGVSVQKFERALRARQSAATCSPGRVSTITNGQLLCKLCYSSHPGSFPCPKTGHVYRLRCCKRLPSRRCRYLLPDRPGRFSGSLLCRWICLGADLSAQSRI